MGTLTRPPKSLKVPSYVDLTSTHQTVEPRVYWVRMGPHELKPQKTREGEEAGRGRLRRGMGSDEKEQSRQRNPPATVDHLKVVQVGACV